MTVKPTPPSPARDKVRATVPKLIDLTEKVVYGDVWERPELSKRDRSLITCAALVVLNRTEQLKGHIERALNNGVTPGGDRRADHAPGVLRRLARRHVQRHGREGRAREAQKVRARERRAVQANIVGRERPTMLL